MREEKGRGRERGRKNEQKAKKKYCWLNWIERIIYLQQQFEICTAISAARLHCVPNKISYHNLGHWLVYNLNVKIPSVIMALRKWKNEKRNHKTWQNIASIFYTENWIRILFVSVFQCKYITLFFFILFRFLALKIKSNEI